MGEVGLVAGLVWGWARLAPPRSMARNITSVHISLQAALYLCPYPLLMLWDVLGFLWRACRVWPMESTVRCPFCMTWYS